jgi:Aspartyl protease/Tetratricopeptide repeat
VILTAAAFIASAFVTPQAQQDDLPSRKESVRAALRTAQFDQARAAAEQLKGDAPADPEVVALYGDALWASGLFDEAEQTYHDALQRAPQFSRARYGVARALATRSRLGDALDETLAALATTPDDPDVHALAGNIYERLARYDEAADEYDRYAALVPAQDPLPAQTALARAMFLRSFKGRTPLSMRPKEADALHTAPFRLVKNKIIVEGRINGSRVDWVLDTGAERTGISFDAAMRTGVRPVTSTLTAGVGTPRLRQVLLGRIDSLEVGSLKIRNVPVSIRNPVIRGAPRWQGESLSPLALGLSAIVDYQRRRVTFGHTLPSQADDITLPMRFHRLAMVRGVLNAHHPAYFVVDTGGELISISADTADALDMHPVRRIPLRVFGLSGLDEGAFLLPGIDLDFDAIGYRKVGLAVLNLRAPSVLLGFRLGGIVGHKFLGEYRVTMDVERSELRLER